MTFALPVASRNRPQARPEPECAATAGSVLRWQQAGGGRHARCTAKNATGIRAGESFIALCGEAVTANRSDVHAEGGVWLNPTCPRCTSNWKRLMPSATGELAIAPDTALRILVGDRGAAGTAAPTDHTPAVLSGPARLPA
ncbi:zinc finger protein [Amycolatopsis sp. NPDC004079]|uniref:zinc finger protein n=1 Tax=Amycolatopsis sp. NPDC004079 TaxID=3154549 RepID=UPI0033B159CD